MRLGRPVPEIFFRLVENAALVEALTGQFGTVCLKFVGSNCTVGHVTAAWKWMWFSAPRAVYLISVARHYLGRPKEYALAGEFVLLFDRAASSPR